MSADVFQESSKSVAVPGALDRARSSRRTAVRIALAFVCALAVAAGLMVSQPEAYLREDADLARLLRAMGWVKAVLVLAGLAVMDVWLRHCESLRATAAYLLAAGSMVFATTLMLGLAHIAAAATLFHLGAIAIFIIAAVESRSRPPYPKRGQAIR